MKKYFKKKDLIVCLIIILLIMLFSGIKKFSENTTPTKVIVMINNEQTGEYNLNQDLTKVIKTENGYNKLVIKDGEVYISEADCENKLCIKEGKIKDVNEMIVCLPHNLVIKIVGEGDYDAISN